MSINGELLATLLLPFMLLFGVLAYFLGKRKTTTPVITGVWGALSGLFPPLGIIFLMLLVLKNDMEN
ncbi:hypothetical protein A9267_14125 [Shewanella sp. UCD-FRSSP16_17]|uniref:hypothetical protein n=1 Tax=Shewanella sp. UCD-FRSSP16_17 TaxID=1853256 RepID=UPI0007EEF03C|nr:hypothetical protein [Shewanella sp. UCD-FRSSP16_17]OBT07007.1 hypothetical protein A9267_14125 [Shewanella sp. UCD-FRSSP16_17]